MNHRRRAGKEKYQATLEQSKARREEAKGKAHQHREGLTKKRAPGALN